MCRLPQSASHLEALRISAPLESGLASPRPPGACQDGSLGRACSKPGSKGSPGTSEICAVHFLGTDHCSPFDQNGWYRKVFLGPWTMDIACAYSATLHGYHQPPLLLR